MLFKNKAEVFLLTEVFISERSVVDEKAVLLQSYTFKSNKIGFMCKQLTLVLRPVGKHTHKRIYIYTQTVFSEKRVEPKAPKPIAAGLDCSYLSADTLNYSHTESV